MLTFTQLTQLTQTIGDTAVAPWNHEGLSENIKNLLTIGGFFIVVIILAAIFIKLISKERGGFMKTLSEVNLPPFLAATAICFFGFVLTPLHVYSTSQSPTVNTQPVQQQLQAHNITVDNERLTSAIMQGVETPRVINAVKDDEVVQLAILSVKNEDDTNGSSKHGDYIVTWEVK